jgi:hypothetical protein
MIANANKARHWRYFLLLEAEFETTMSFIEPVPQNDGVFSLQLAKQLLTICAQFETICRLRVAETNPGSPANNINDFYTELLQEKPHLNNAWAMLLTTKERICPFASWKVNSPPVWWTDHNKVKHDPSIQLEKGNMANVRFALAALGILTHYYVGKGSRIHESRLFTFSL